MGQPAFPIRAFLGAYAAGAGLCCSGWMYVVLRLANNVCMIFFLPEKRPASMWAYKQVLRVSLTSSRGWGLWHFRTQDLQLEDCCQSREGMTLGKLCYSRLIWNPMYWLKWMLLLLTGEENRKQTETNPVIPRKVGQPKGKDTSDTCPFLLSCLYFLQ